MQRTHGAAVALLVLLAGCGGILGGGGGTATPPSTTQPMAPSAAPSTATPAPSATTASMPTATPPPTGSYVTRTVTNESLRTTFELRGNKGALRSFLLVDVTGIRITQGKLLECARASPFVAVSTNGSVADVSTTMGYDPSQLPANASESELSVFVYNRTVDFYLEMETRVDTANDTASATRVAPGQTFTRETDEGTERITPELDGTRLDNAFVVMHAPTWWEAVESGEVPARCGSATPTPAPNATGTTTGN